MRKLLNREDILISGNFYKILKNQSQQKKTKAKNYYYNLIENQYLTKTNNYEEF
jgi:hypothetical protein